MAQSVVSWGERGATEAQSVVSWGERAASLDE